VHDNHRARHVGRGFSTLPRRMSSLESLPPDQRAVLALVLQRGRSYDEIAALLAIDRAAVRDRALSAMDALGPSEARMSAERRALITDYLLGQLPVRVRDQVRELLSKSPSERAWARVLASELTPLSDKPLPEIPSGPVSPTPEPAATPAAQAAPSPGAPATPPLGAEPPADDGAPAAPAPSGGGVPAPVPAGPPRSRGGGGVLLAIAAVIAVVVVIVIIATSGGSSPKKSGSTTTASTPTTSSTTTGTSTTSKAHVVSEVALKPTSTSTKAAGIAEIVVEGKVTGVIVAADHLTPNTTHNAYAVWLSNPSGQSKLLGYVSPAVGKNGDLKTSGPLPSNVASYKEILVTLETTTDTKTPGPTVLSGPLSLKSG
jgi:Sigma-70, region 4